VRKIIVYIATSADGYIARPDGDVGWLDRPQPPGGYGMKAFLRSVDTVVWGRKTYDVGRKLGQTSFPGKTNLVFSRRPRRLAPGVQQIQGDVAGFARRLRRARGKHIWLMGGGELIASFLDTGEIDELMVFVIPVLIGKGIALIAPRHRDIPLTLLGSRRYANGVVRLHYRVPRLRRRGRTGGSGSGRRLKRPNPRSD
jgi:dihydrofolate reductase